MESAGRRPLRVVVIDDVPEIRDIAQMMLEADGRFRVVAHAADADTGVAATAREQPDVVLLDIEMPGQNGWEALPRVKEAAPGAAVVIFSGEDNTATSRRLARERGAHGFLQKGLEARRLASQLVDELGTATQLFAPAPAAPVRLPLVPDEPADVVARRLAALVESADDAIIARDLDGTIMSWNPAAERIFGYSADEIVGTNIARLLPDESASEMTAILGRILAGEPVRLETTRRHKSGTVVDVQLRVSPIADAAGRIVGATSVMRDLGDRDRRDRALARAIAQLERQNRTLLHANEELDRFAYVASHDLAQPLQVIYGYLELLEDQYGDQLDPTAREWVDVVVRNVERMRRLVRDLLHYARLGSRPSPREPVDCNDVLADAIANLSLTIEERGAQVSADRLPTIEADRTQLCQVFQNLISNAIKYTPADRVPIVHVATVPDHEGHRIDVLDNGSGIPANDRARIFEMFQRAAADSEGSGLGLAIVKRVVEQHGGRVWVEDRSSGGSRFSFTLRPPS